MKIDVRQPEGNVFCILGVLQNLKRELNKAGVQNPEIDKILKEARGMKYDQILDAIEEATHGTISFVGRDAQEEE